MNHSMVVLLLNWCLTCEQFLVSSERVNAIARSAENDAKPRKERNGADNLSTNKNLLYVDHIFMMF